MTDTQAHLPDRWVECSIDDLLLPLEDGRTLHHGWSPQCETEPSLVEDDWGVLKTTAIQSGRFVPEQNKRLPNSLTPRPRLEVKPGDILLTCAGPRARCGVPCLVRTTRRRLMISGKMYRFRVPQQCIEPRYLEAYLLSERAQSTIDRMKTGISDSGLNLTHYRFRQLRVPVAPSSEQLRIVAEIEKQLTRLDAAVGALKRVQANLKRYRAAVLKAAVEGHLVPTEAELARLEGRPYEPASELLKRILAERRARWEAGQLAKFRPSGKLHKDEKWKQMYKQPESPDATNLSNLPNGWTWASLEQISWDAGYGTSQKCDYECSGPPVLRIPNIIRGKVELDELKFAKDAEDLTESEALVPGDMLIVRTNGSRDLIGRTAVVEQPFPRPHFFASYLIRYRLVAAEGLAKWVSTIWDEFSNRRRIEELAATTAGQYNVSVGKVNGLPIALPPQAEMQRIVTEIERRLSVTDELERQIETDLKRAERLRQAILKRAFGGKLVPQDPNDEPARVLLERIRAEREARETSAPRLRQMRKVGVR